MLDITRLRVFRAVVNAGSVQAAAANLGYSPSAVSQHITALQRETGLVLFEKSGRGINPTATGVALASSSEEVMASLTRLQGTVDDLREGRTAALSVGTLPSAGQYWMPRMARELSAEYPDLVLRLDLVDLGDRTTSEYDLDLRAEDPGEPPQVLPGYRRVHLLDEPYVVVAPADHPLCGGGDVSLVDVASERLIEEGPRAALCAQILQRSWGAVGVAPHYVAHVSDHHAAIALVEAGVGLTVLPRLAMGSLPNGLVARHFLDAARPVRRLVVFVREQAGRTTAARRAVELLKDIAMAGDPVPVG